ncbi:MAG: sigma-70 family RNA polymerase sigma factor [Rhodospirillales bacterium]|nr:sigma-70 family RNA polymerase sigma factor [Rhodospirillales bacterium]
MSAAADLHPNIAYEIPRLRRYARALVRNQETADDLVQDTLVRALSKLHLWQPGTDLRAWLFTLMHNQYVNFVRRAVREGTQTPLESAVNLGHQASQTTFLTLRDLQNALERLPDEQRTVVLLIGLEGMRYEEVAEILNVPVGTIRSRLSRAREALREMMDEHERRPMDGRSRRGERLQAVA